MKCCINCFIDPEIKAIIKAQNVHGKCDFCGKNNTYVYDIQKDNNLTELLEGLLDVYKPESNLSKTFPREKRNLVKNIMYYEWNIFNVTPECIYKLITEICHEKYEEQSSLFDLPVAISESEDIDYLRNNSIIGEYKWDDFVDEIKCRNRFHTNYFNKDILKNFLGYIEKTYRAGNIFYRARIAHDDLGFEVEDMGAPPAEKATAGRANSEGISCLYLADSKETALHEIRAGVYDYIAVGNFKLLQDIRVINLMDIDRVSPFKLISSIEYTQYAININHLHKISSEISKPLRRNDSHLDYLPTQYISDYIKSLGYDGIQYKSTMCPNGFNLAIFNQEYFECIEVHVDDITSLDYNCRPVS